MNARVEILWTGADAARATGGKAVGEWAVSGLSIDTRSVRSGDLFVPLKDARDGHDFIPQAYENGASAVISERPILDAPALIVKDSLKALADLAKAARRRSSAKRIAVTGSVGKTSVKEMIAHIARAAGKTHASIKSYNNHWGVPLTLAGMAQNTKYGVFELGMNHAAELAHLTQIVRPDIAVITKVAPAHLAHFKNVKAIALAKAEILSGLSESGVAILPRDDEFYGLLLEHNSVKTKTFGRHEDADARIISAAQTKMGSSANIVIGGKNLLVELLLTGEHWAENAAISLLVCECAGIDLGLAIRALKTFGAPAGRGETSAVVIGGKAATLIDESYNANPISMAAAIAALGLSSGRTIAVLGDMLELGETEAALHVGLLEPLTQHKIDLVLTCGARMKSLHDVLPSTINGGWSERHGDCHAALAAIVCENDIIMIKGSNASGMSKLVYTLKNNKKNNKINEGN